MTFPQTAVSVREERAADSAAIREVVQLAFGQAQEANIVDALRANGAALLSLVATIADRVVGHIMYSPLTIGEVTGAGLAPMAVLPEYQRQGIGGRLIEEGTRRLRVARCPFIVVLGHAEYYPRFGFRPARGFGITCQWDVPDDHFMVLPLDPLAMTQVSGLAMYRAEFSTVT